MDLTSILSWDWPSILGAFLGAGVATAIVEFAFTQYREGRERERRASHLATRLVAGLERYARECADFIIANQNAPHHPEEEFPDWNATLPPPPEMPVDDTGWPALDQRIAGKCFALRNTLEIAQGRIASTIEYSAEDLDVALDEEAATIGIEAWSIAGLLRARYKLGDFAGSWDFATHLKGALDKASSEKAAREVKRREFSRKVFSAAFGPPTAD